ncbi:cytochrome C, partial [Aromatoleum toluclasticum]|nr:cytochrome C [Aromatoleum toluclasticum]
APAGFASFQPHGHTGDFERYQQMWLANQLMIQLLVGTFGFFWLHTLLWFWRELRDRLQGRTRPHVRADAPGLAGGGHAGKHFRRFTTTWRAAHLAF